MAWAVPVTAAIRSCSPKHCKAACWCLQARLTMDSNRGHVNDVTMLNGRPVGVGEVTSERALLTGTTRIDSLVAMEEPTAVRPCFCTALPVQSLSAGSSMPGWWHAV